MIAEVTNGSFGPIASARQGSPRGTAMHSIISSKFLGGSVRPPTVTQGVQGPTLGNIGAALPSTGSVTGAVNTGGATPAVAAAATTARSATKSPNVEYIAGAIALLLVLFFVWK